MTTNEPEALTSFTTTTASWSFVNDVTLNLTSTTTSNFTANDLVRLNNAKARTLIPAMVVLGVLMVVGIVGNTLVCYVFCFRLKRGTQNFLIICLAVFDLLSCTIAIPNEIADMRYYYMFGSEAACKIIRFINTFTAIGSIVTLLVIAIDRYRKICKPFKGQLYMIHVKLSLLPILGLAVIFGWPALVMYGLRTTETEIPGLNGYDCSTPDEVKDTIYPLLYNSILFLAFIILMITLIVLYCLILRETKRHNRYMRKNSDYNIPSGVSGHNNTEDSESNVVVNPDASIVCYSPSKGIVSREKGVFRYSSEKVNPALDTAESHATPPDIIKCLENDGCKNGDSFHGDEIVEPSEPMETNGVASSVDVRDGTHDTAHQSDGNDTPEDTPHTDHNKLHDLSDYDNAHNLAPRVDGCDSPQDTDTLHDGPTIDCDTTHNVAQTSHDNTNNMIPKIDGSDTPPHAPKTDYVIAQDISHTKYNRRLDISPTNCEIDSFQDTLPSSCGSASQDRSTTGYESDTTLVTFVESSGCRCPTKSILSKDASPKTTETKPNLSHSSHKISFLKQKPSVKIKAKPKRYKSKTTIIAFLVTMVFILSFLPHLSLQVSKIIYKDFDYNLGDSALVAYNLFLRSYFINSVSNPIIYGALNAQFSSEVKSLAKRVYWKLQSLCGR